MSWKHQLGKQIKDARKSVKMTQQDLADKVGVARQMINRYEAGRDAPAIDVLAEIAWLLEVELQVLGYRIAVEKTDRRFIPRPVPKQLELPLDKPKRFSKAVVEITPRHGRIVIRADIPA